MFSIYVFVNSSFTPLETFENRNDALKYDLQPIIL